MTDTKDTMPNNTNTKEQVLATDQKSQSLDFSKMSPRDLAKVNPEELSLQDKIAFKQALKATLSSVTANLDRIIAGREESERIKREEAVEKHEAALATPTPELLARLKQAGILDSSFDNEDCHPLTIRPLTQDEAYAEYLAGPDSPEVTEEQKKFTYTTPKAVSLNVLMLQFDDVTRKSSDLIVAKMKDYGLRPLTHEELIQYTIKNPTFQKESALVALGTKQKLSAVTRVPLARWLGSRRRLLARRWAGEWFSVCRFPAVAI